MARGNTRVDFPLNATYYPIKRFVADLAASRLQEDEIVLPFFIDAALNSDSSGKVVDVFSNNPSSLAQWSSLIAVWDEYRVLNMRVAFIPGFPVGGSTFQTILPIASVVDRDNSTVLGSYSDAQSFGSFQEYGGAKPFHRDVPLSNSGEDNGFIDTSNPIANGWIKFYCAGANASQPFGRVQRTFLIQFRGRGV